MTHDLTNDLTINNEWQRQEDLKYLQRQAERRKELMADAETRQQSEHWRQYYPATMDNNERHEYGLRCCTGQITETEYVRRLLAAGEIGAKEAFWRRERAGEVSKAEQVEHWRQWRESAEGKMLAEEERRFRATPEGAAIRQRQRDELRAWHTHPWPISKKGNPYTNIGGCHTVVYPQGDGWGFRVDRDDIWPHLAERTYGSQIEAKRAAMAVVEAVVDGE